MDDRKRNSMLFSLAGLAVLPICAAVLVLVVSGHPGLGAAVGNLVWVYAVFMPVLARRLGLTRQRGHVTRPPSARDD